MDPAWTWTFVVAAVLAGVHVAASASHGFALPEAARAAFGASPGSTLARPWTHLTAPFFHYGWGHLAYNLAILLATMPVALRAVGVGRGVALSYATSPLVGIAVNLLVVLPLARAGIHEARAAVDVPLVGASVVVFAAAGIACGAMLGAHGWGARWSLFALAAFVGYELVLRSLGATQHFVWLYHASGFGIGLFLAKRLL